MPSTSLKRIPPSRMIPISEQKAIFPTDRWGFKAFIAMMMKSEPPVDEFLV